MIKNDTMKMCIVNRGALSRSCILSVPWTWWYLSDQTEKDKDDLIKNHKRFGQKNVLIHILFYK